VRTKVIIWLTLAGEHTVCTRVQYALLGSQQRKIKTDFSTQVKHKCTNLDSGHVVSR
jgi:hypothetical protein